MGLANLEARFKQLIPTRGSIAEQAHAAILDAARKINALVDDSPVLLSIVQHLEQAAHLVVSNPALAEPAPSSTASSPAQPANPTQEGATTSTATSSTTSSNDSAATSSGKSKG